MHRLILSAAVAFAVTASVHAQTYKQLPPPGIEISEKDRVALTKRVGELRHQVDEAASASTDAAEWRPDVDVLIRAVALALEQDLFFKESDPKKANVLLDEATRRLKAVRDGKRGLELLGLGRSTDDEPQLLVGGFVSRIDDTVQPYGLVVPAGYQPKRRPTRVDVWLHGRGDTKTEIPFLHERMTRVGQYAPKNTLVLHPFGRHCNAFKFAGETDVYEAIDHLGSVASIDRDRIAIRGFSMGGAGCWHLAVHNPGYWFAANPGAGFVDTIVYQGWAEKAPIEFDSTRMSLMKWYDVLPWTLNLSNTNTVAYSGEIDKQKQAADRVVTAANKMGIKIPYVIGDKMGHKIDPPSAAKIEATLDDWAAKSPSLPRKEIDFVTYTLRYNQVEWLSITGMEEHWKAARVRALILNDRDIQIETTGVTRLNLDFAKSGWPQKPLRPSVTVDGQRLSIDDWGEAPGIQCELVQLDDGWAVVEEVDARLRKRPGLQGPIDDAFCERFLFVVPSRPAVHGVVQRWIDRELEYAQSRWSRLMRGDVRVVKDTELTPQQIETCHLVCFGDFFANRYLHGIASHLPIKWSRDELKVGNRKFDPSTHAAAFCFPNPRNPDRYVVVNSGLTFREFSNNSNSRQIAMLPDWAVMEVGGEDDGVFPGKIVADGFFDEQWSLKENRP